MKNEPSIVIREATKSDGGVLRVLINEIIHIGGTTAIESPLSDTEFGEYFLNGPNFIYCHVATTRNNKILGFQSLTQHPKLAEGWADIATFTRQNPKIPGVGTALFNATILYAKKIKLEAINATIRRDNIPGLSYYSKMGFVDYSVDRAVPLSDGTPIDRVSKKIVIEDTSGAA
ncbi:MAG: GNAT family N-acetyltransferase [Oceanicoccus sp.]